MSRAIWLLFKRRVLFLLPLFFVSSSCTKNYLADFVDRSTDEYMIDETRNYLDKGDYNNAINTIMPVLASQPQNSDVVYLAAASYAGRAGLRVLDMFTDIALNTSEGRLLFHGLARHMSGATSTDLRDLEVAYNIIEGFRYEAADRPASMNFFSLFVYFAYVGAVLNIAAIDPATGDVMAGYNACLAASLPEIDTDRVMIMIPRILDAINNSGGASSAISVTGLPTTLPKDPVDCPGAGAVNIARCKAVRGLVDGEIVGFKLGHVPCP